ncbi:MAG: 2-C-methyl-D-erythritol 4-phosphate cytidylyltransferase [Bacteroidales bacterium]
MEAFIIVAGGKGLRVGGVIPKQFMPLNGKPVLMHTIQAFYNFNPVGEVILVLPKTHFDYWKRLCSEYKFDIPHLLVEGGKERFFSVRNGLLAVKRAHYVAIHDGVRPLVSIDLIRRIMKEVREQKAVIPVVPLSDSIRQITLSKESIALDRSSYCLVQTPQAFHYPKLMMAYRSDYNQNFTDDASVWEADHRKVYMVDGERRNIKITQTIDFSIAEAILENS